MRISDWSSDVCSSDLSAKAALNGHEKCGCAPTAAVQTLILDTIKPFEDGGHHLYGVHKLDIADKHHMLIPTQAAMVIHRLAFLSPSGVPTGGSIERVTLISPYGEQAAAIGLNSGIGAKLDGDPRAAFDIRFAKGEIGRAHV